MLTRQHALITSKPPHFAAALAAALSGGVTPSSLAAGRLSAPPCATSQLRLKLGLLVSEKTVQHTATFTLQNVERSSCSLDGYPTVRPCISQRQAEDMNRLAHRLAAPSARA